MIKRYLVYIFLIAWPIWKFSYSSWDNDTCGKKWLPGISHILSDMDSLVVVGSQALTFMFLHPFISFTFLPGFFMFNLLFLLQYKIEIKKHLNMWFCIICSHPVLLYIIVDTTKCWIFECFQYFLSLSLSLSLSLALALSLSLSAYI